MKLICSGCGVIDQVAEQKALHRFPLFAVYTYLQDSLCHHPLTMNGLRGVDQRTQLLFRPQVNGNIVRYGILLRLPVGVAVTIEGHCCSMSLLLAACPEQGPLFFNDPESFLMYRSLHVVRKRDCFQLAMFNAYRLGVSDGCLRRLTAVERVEYLIPCIQVASSILTMRVPVEVGLPRFDGDHTLLIACKGELWWPRLIIMCRNMADGRIKPRGCHTQADLHCGHLRKSKDPFVADVGCCGYLLPPVSYPCIHSMCLHPFTVCGDCLLQHQAVDFHGSRQRQDQFTRALFQ